MKDQPVDELRRICLALYNCGKSDADALIPVGFEAIFTEAEPALQAECNRARIEEVTLMEECVDDFQGYAKDRIAELQQLMKEGE